MLPLWAAEAKEWPGGVLTRYNRPTLKSFGTVGSPVPWGAPLVPWGPPPVPREGLEPGADHPGGRPRPVPLPNTTRPAHQLERGQPSGKVGEVEGPR